MIPLMYHNNNPWTASSDKVDKIDSFGDDNMSWDRLGLDSRKIHTGIGSHLKNWYYRWWNSTLINHPKTERKYRSPVITGTRKLTWRKKNQKMKNRLEEKFERDPEPRIDSKKFSWDRKPIINWRKRLYNGNFVGFGFQVIGYNRKSIQKLLELRPDTNSKKTYLTIETRNL